jgi:hypothetical protein
MLLYITLSLFLNTLFILAQNLKEFKMLLVLYTNNVYWKKETGFCRRVDLVGLVIV